MTLNRVKLVRVVIFVKYLASVDPLTFLSKTLTWTKIALLTSYFLNFVNELKNCVSKNIYQYSQAYPSYHRLM